jgi:sialate O-acetylesterase
MGPGTGSLPSGLISRRFRGKFVKAHEAGGQGRLRSKKRSSYKLIYTMGSSRHRGSVRHIPAGSVSLRVSACSAVGLCIFACGPWCRADPVLPSFISDHMVLQQGREIHIWGKADAGETVTVSLAGRAVAATTDARNHWSVQVPALSAGGPFTLSIQGNKKIEIKDVMIGEVWIASGQSNMTFSLDSAEGAATEVPNADYPQIRLFTVPRKIALSPQEDTLPARWQICTPDNAKGFSAVAYFFAREIHRKLNVPVGVVESAWPGTTIEDWVAPEALQADSDLAPVLEEWKHTTPDEKKFAENPLPLGLEFDDFELFSATAGSASKLLANFDDGTARVSTGGSFSYSWEDAPDAPFELVSPGRGAGGFAARVAGRLDGTQDSTLTAHYKMGGTVVDLSSYAGIRFWVRGNGSFRFRSKQPTVTDYDDYATPVLKAPSDWQAVAVWFRDLRQEGWGVTLPFTQDVLSGFTIQSLTTLGYAPIPVSGLYEGMITPLLPSAFRGVLWYQGESNALKAHKYRKLLPALIGSWRDALHDKDLEFLIVQLPNHGATPDQPGESAWSELREAQLLTVQQVPRTGMAVTIDVGDPKDLHPHRKLEVGQRLALWAQGTIYKEPIEYSGPLYESMRIDGSEIRVRFTHVGSGLEVRNSGALHGFAVAGADRKFHWAEARIDGDTVVVSSRDVPRPTAVRYAWGDSPLCNLLNRDGLPASPFRTDDWPGVTGQQ